MPRPGTPEDHEDGTRTCIECGERRPLAEYDRDKSAKLGRRGRCKPCRARAVGAWYEANADRQRTRARERLRRGAEAIRKRDRERYYRDRPKRMQLVLEAGRRRRALLAQVPADEGITYEALRDRDGDECCYCGVTLDFTPGDGKTYVPRKASIEHYLALTSGGHHTWDNVGLACLQCNVRKQATPLAVWLEVAGASTCEDDDRAGLGLDA